MNDVVYDAVVNPSEIPRRDEDFTQRVIMMLTFHHLGYDYATLLHPKPLVFPELKEHHQDKRLIL